MLDIPHAPVLDKTALIGSCVRLGLRVDAAQLRSEIAHLPAEYWGTTSGRIGVHSAADAIFLRGYAPAEGDKPIEDRDVLHALPCAQQILKSIAAPPLRCLIARLPPATTIPPHIDRAPYFAKSIRVHVPIET